MDYQLIAEPAGFTDYRQGGGVFTPAGTSNALALALRVANPGDVVGFRGPLGDVRFNWSNSENKSDVNGGTVGVTIAGVDSTASVRGFSFKQPAAVPDGELGHNHDFTFRDFTILCGTQRPVIFQAKQSGWGVMSWTRIVFEHIPGTNVKWPLHAPASATWEFIGCQFLVPSIEHHIYLHAPVSTTERHALFIDRCYSRQAGRTFVQTVDRETTGLRSSGSILVRDTLIENAGARDGGSAVTVAGHNGTVRLERLKIVSDHTAAGIVRTDTRGQSVDAGAIVCYQDGKMGSHLPPSGFGVGPVEISQVWVNYANPDRDLIALSSCESVDIAQSILLQSDAKKGLNLEHNGQANGPVRFHGRKPPSSWKGWQSGPVRLHDVELTPDELDALTPENQ